MRRHPNRLFVYKNLLNEEIGNIGCQGCNTENPKERKKACFGEYGDLKNILKERLEEDKEFRERYLIEISLHL